MHAPAPTPKAPAEAGDFLRSTLPRRNQERARRKTPALFLSPSREVKLLALGVDDRGLALANRNLAFAGATSHAQSKDNRAEENQDFFHGDATRVYPLNAVRCTDRGSGQLVRKSHTPHNCAPRTARKYPKDARIFEIT